MTAKVELLTPSGGKVILDPTNTAVDRVLTLPAVAGTVFNQGNVVGTVSQSSGVPTGSIIERGSNANGEFVKYADGTMICTRYKSVTVTTLAGGEEYVGAWSSPSLFSEVYYLNAEAAFHDGTPGQGGIYTTVYMGRLFATNNNLFDGRIGNTGRPTNSTLGGAYPSGSTTAQGYTLYTIAIGRWF